MDFIVDNIRCGGCANTITKKLKDGFGVDFVDINVEKGIISIDVESDKSHEVYEVLLGLGYPRTGENNGIFTKVKSFTSCAIGKISS